MKRVFLISTIMMVAIAVSAFAQTNLLPNGDLDTLTPNFWAAVGDAQTGVTCEWAWDNLGHDNSEHSFKVSKTAATADIAGWKSENNADLYWNNASADALYNLGFWVKTEGVNTNPATDDEKIGVKYEFSSGGTSIGESTIYIDQTTADADWANLTDGLLPAAGMEPDEIFVTLFMGKGATGTVYFDDVACGTDPWSMGIFNGDAETPEGWMQWASSSDVGYANLNSEYAHSGLFSALLIEQDQNGDEMVFYSEPIPADPSTWYKLSVWAKREGGLTNEEWIASNVSTNYMDDRMGVCFFSHTGNLYTSFDSRDDTFFYFDERETDSDWTQYTVIYQTTDDATGISMRARFNTLTEGACWYDDFSIEKLDLGPDLLPNGDLDTLTPNFWAAVGDAQTGVTCEWAWDNLGHDNSEHSFKVSKTAATADIAGWKSENNADLYWNNASADALYNLGFWVKTEGVNTNPATDDEKIGVKYEFSSGGTSIGESTIYIDQTTADADWANLTDGLLPAAGMEPDEIFVTLFMGKGATGTVYFDDVACGTDPWSMGIFNGDAETPEGWMQWASSSDVGYANLNSEYAHSGLFSALLIEQDQNGDEMVFYSEPIPADPSTWYKLSVWAKREGGLTNEEWIASNVSTNYMDDRMGVCFFSHTGNLYTSFDSRDDTFFYFDERETDSDWTQYTVIYQTTDDATGISMRARFNTLTEGACWYDDFSIEKVDVLSTGVEHREMNGNTSPEKFGLGQNYPNPFNPTTQIGYILKKDGHVELTVYNMMGQKIRTLVDQHRQAGAYKVMWDSRNESGAPVESGVYFYQLKTADNVVTKRMIYVK